MNPNERNRAKSWYSLTCFLPVTVMLQQTYLHIRTTNSPARDQDQVEEENKAGENEGWTDGLAFRK